MAMVYKGMLHQQDPNGETNLIRGMVAVRKLHKRVIVEAGLTTADEMLYPENLVFVDDLVSYHAVGARSVEDQQHRFVASGIDAPTGLKNPTSGNMKYYLTLCMLLKEVKNLSLAVVK